MTSVTPFALPDGTELEPMLLLDISGSMGYAASNRSNSSRKDVVCEAIRTIVGRLAAVDSQAAEEEEGGGLYVVAFNNEAHDVGDINTENLDEKWNRIPWGGGTRIVPGFNTLLKQYRNEFIVGAKPGEKPPVLLCLVITDGEASDERQFEETLTKLSGEVYVVTAIVGYGEDHDRTMKSYQRIESSNSHLRVIPFAGETDPNVIADAVMSMIQ